jgi:Rod binding domain-containing protein
MTATGGIGPTEIAVAGRQLSIGSQGGAPESPDHAKLRKAAGEFESILLASMWKSMKKSFGDDDSDNSTDPAHGTLEDWGIEVMSDAVGKAGGMGIGNMILKHLEPEVHDADSSNSGQSIKALGTFADVSMRRRADATP